jgi:hypothetical protein
LHFAVSRAVFLDCQRSAPLNNRKVSSGFGTSLFATRKGGREVTLLILTTIAFLGLCAAALAVGDEGRFRGVCYFLDPQDVAGIRVTGARAKWSATTEDDAITKGVAFELDAVRGGALHLAMPGGGGYTTVEYDAEGGMPTDWAGYDQFVMNFENASEFMINMHLTVKDGSGAECFIDNLWICRSRSAVSVPLEWLRTADGEALDYSDIRSVKIEIRSAEKFDRDMWLYQFYLVKDLPAVVPATEDTMLLDFGPLGGRIIPGARLVHEAAAYGKWRGCGWTAGASALMSTNAKSLDNLNGTWVWGDVSDEPAVLRVDLPDGKYRARFYGGNYNEKNVAVLSFALSVNGEKVAEKTVDPDSYYTTEGHFAGMDKWFAPGEDPYAKHVKPFFQEYDFAFEVEGGFVEFKWEETLAAYALLIAPEGGFDAAAEAVEESRRAEFAANTAEPEKANSALKATTVDEARGFALWRSSHLQPAGVYDLAPDAARDPGEIAYLAARGEREIACLTLTPTAEIGEIAVEVSDLVGEGGANIPASAVSVRALKYLWTGWPATVAPGYLLPSATAPGVKGVNRTFYLTLKVPGDTPGGAYRGKVTISTEKGGSAEVAIAATVRPFALTEDHGISYAFWRCSPYNMNYCLRYFLPEKLDYLRRIHLAAAAHMAEHGLTSYYFTPPIIKSVEGNHVEFDFTVLDMETEACLKYGLSGPKNPGMVFTLPDIARYIMKETCYGDYMEPTDLSLVPEEVQTEEFDEVFTARYIDAIRQIDEYFKSKGLNVLIYPADEPRECNTNRWNRNLADTIKYCEIIRKNVPGAKIYVDPMHHENSGVDYLPLAEHVDVLGTHPWDKSANFNEYCKTHDTPDLAYFNAIVWDRYDFGFQVAAAKATAFWQWHFQWDLLPFVPFHTGFKWGLTIPGPDGPIDKPRIEIFSESVDDYRYLATLEERIGAAKASGKASVAVAAAEKALGEFYAVAPEYPVQGRDYAPRRSRDVIGGKTLDEWRSAFAECIEAIDAAE